MYLRLNCLDNLVFISTSKWIVKSGLPSKYLKEKLTFFDKICVSHRHYPINSPVKLSVFLLWLIHFILWCNISHRLDDIVQKFLVLVFEDWENIMSLERRKHWIYQMRKFAQFTFPTQAGREHIKSLKIYWWVVSY